MNEPDVEYRDTIRGIEERETALKCRKLAGQAVVMKETLTLRSSS